MGKKYVEAYELPEFIPVFSLDSEIEEIFYKKCLTKKKWMPLIMEWANSKTIYIKYTNLIVGMFGNYSKHDCSHSVSILNSIYAVIGENRIECLEVMDLWLMLHCAYAHDIGMPYTYDEALKWWQSLSGKSEFKDFLRELHEGDDEDNKRAVEYLYILSEKIGVKLIDEKLVVDINKEFTTEWPVRVKRYCSYLTAEYCRKDHAKRVEELLNKPSQIQLNSSSFKIDARFYKYVGKCSMLHGEDFDKVLEINKKEWSSYGYCHPAFVAAMLRVGDLLDIDNDRFDEIVLKNYGELPQLSKIHKMKHESIQHIYYEKNRIEIVAVSDDEEVCKCASEWFEYLNREIQNIIFHWGEIAPECLGGCEFSLPKTEIKYNGQEFRTTENLEFQINKNMLIDLVIGRNLYHSKLDFIREYIQNSFDALKMKFWLELKDESENNAIYFKNEYVKKVKKSGLLEINPFFFKEATFESLNVIVCCEWIEEEKGKGPYIQIKISDRGIGIDKECVEAISHIGSSWKRRKKYKKHLSNMPAWLCPTGGFGIGMQSGFMISDRIDIRTKCEGDMKGRHLVLHSSEKSGKIEQRNIDLENRGTEVSVKIPYEWFMEGQNYSCYNLHLEREKLDYFFERDDIINYIVSIVANYLKEIVGNSLFPIHVISPGFEPRIIQNKIPGSGLEESTIELNGVKYNIYKNERFVYIWEPIKCILCKIDTKVNYEDADLTWYYKGVRVENKQLNKEEKIMARVVGDISIDIMGMNVRDCLTIDRNEFAGGFDTRQLLENMLKVYFKLYDEILDIIDFVNTKSIVSKRKEDYYKMILYLRFREEQSILADSIRAYLELVNNRIDSTSRAGLLIPVYGSIDKQNIYKAFIFLPAFCEQLYKDMYSETFYFCDKDMSADAEAGNEEDNKTGEKIIVCDDVVYHLLKCFYSEETENIGKKQEYKCFCITERKEEKEDKEEKKEVFGNAINTRIIVFETDVYYKELFVSELPFSKEKSSYTRNKNMIISPINPINGSEEIIIKRFERAEDRETAFREWIIADESFGYLVNWVVNHQVIPNKYTEKEIREKYIELIDYIYQNYVVDLFNSYNK